MLFAEWTPESVLGLVGGVVSILTAAGVGLREWFKLKKQEDRTDERAKLDLREAEQKIDQGVEEKALQRFDQQFNQISTAYGKLQAACERRLSEQRAYYETKLDETRAELMGEVAEAEGARDAALRERAACREELAAARERLQFLEKQMGRTT